MVKNAADVTWSRSAVASLTSGPLCRPLHLAEFSEMVRMEKKPRK